MVLEEVEEVLLAVGEQVGGENEYGRKVSCYTLPLFLPLRRGS